jgi:hypothetical protein
MSNVYNPLAQGPVTYIDRETLKSHCSDSLSSFNLNDYHMWNFPETGHLTTGIIGDGIQNFWRPGEWLWLGQVPSDLCFFDPPGEYYSDFCRFFETKDYLNEEMPEDYYWDDTEETAHQNFLKQCWLASEFVEAGYQFENPVTAHWNPIAGNFKIHPGGCRNKILSMFGGPEIYAFMFNTMSFYVDWMDNMEPVDLDVIREEHGWIGVIVPDHGTYIPHMTKGLHSIKMGNQKWHDILHNKLVKDPIKIYSSVPISQVADWATSDPQDADVEVYFKKRPTPKNLCTAMIATFAGFDWTTDEIEVIHAGKK